LVWSSRAGQQPQLDERVADQVLAVGEQQPVEAEFFGTYRQPLGLARNRETVHPELAGHSHDCNGSAQSAACHRDPGARFSHNDSRR
jgi:hypothetical protein